MNTQPNNKTGEGNAPREILKGTIAREAVQCVDASTQETGDWLYTGDSILYRVSPVFERLPELYQWAKQNGWNQEGGAYIYRG